VHSSDGGPGGYGTSHDVAVTQRDEEQALSNWKQGKKGGYFRIGQSGRKIYRAGRK